MSNNPHVLVLPYPVQGHVIPLMELSQTLANHGFVITFVTTNSTHERVMDGLANLGENIRLVSILDELDTTKIEQLIVRINESEKDKIACILADQSLGWAMDLGKKMNIKRVAFLPAAVATLVLGFNIPKLIEDGVINEDGTPTKDQTVQLSPTMPAINTNNFVWNRIGNPTTQKSIFQLMVRNNESIESADYIISNSTYSLEPGAFTLVPQILPIGPILGSNHRLEPEDSSCCLDWLDEQSKNSVIYVAFGSIAVFSKKQFYELALGLEQTNRPFLWVVRSDTIYGNDKTYPEGFLNRVGNFGKIVKWAPQKRVLSHYSIACFVSHCGWNSTIEGVSNGLPFLCWPCFADQFMNESYICDVWKVGLGLEKDGNGIVTKGEISRKVDQLLDDENSFRERAQDIKRGVVRSISEDGNSFKNFMNIVEWMKE